MNSFLIILFTNFLILGIAYLGVELFYVIMEMLDDRRY